MKRLIDEPTGGEKTRLERAVAHMKKQRAADDLKRDYDRETQDFIVAPRWTYGKPEFVVNIVWKLLAPTKEGIHAYVHHDALNDVVRTIACKSVTKPNIQPMVDDWFDVIWKEDEQSEGYRNDPRDHLHLALEEDMAGQERDRRWVSSDATALKDRGIQPA